MKTSDLPERCIIDIGSNSPMEIQKELHYLGYTWASGASLLTLTYPNITCYKKVGNYIFYAGDLQELKNKSPNFIVIKFENFSNTKRLYDD
jgi:hypothetical protein